MSTLLFHPGFIDLILPIAMASPAGGSGGQQPGLTSFLPMIIILVLIFYMLVFRPQKKKQKEHNEMVNSLKKGDKVITAGGVHGIVAGLKDNIIVVKIADNVKIEVSKGSVSAVIKKEGSTT